MRVVLRSTPHSADSSVLEFFDARWDDFSFVCTAAVTIGPEHRSIGLEFHRQHVPNMIGFFNDMERYRQGSTGVMRWGDGEFGDLHLAVRNPSGLEATFDVLMRFPPDYEDTWSGSLVVPADDLPRAAEAMRTLTGVSEGRRWKTRGPRGWEPL